MLSAPSVREDVEQGMAGMIGREYPEAQMLMGTATAGIAHAAIAAAIRVLVIVLAFFIIVLLFLYLGNRT